MTDSINVALIGSKFMGRAHSNAWLNVARFFDVDPSPVMQTVVGRNAAELDAFASRWGWHEGKAYHPGSGHYRHQPGLRSAISSSSDR